MAAPGLIVSEHTVFPRIAEKQIFAAVAVEVTVTAALPPDMAEVMLDHIRMLEMAAKEAQRSRKVAE